MNLEERGLESQGAPGACRSSWATTGWSKSSSSLRFTIFCLVALGLVLLAHAAFLYGPIEDDAFISYRYSRNLADGHGLVYNPGERVEGYTTFLWVVLGAAGVGFLHVDPIVWSLIVGLLIALATILVVYRLARHLLPPWAAPIPALLLVSNSSVVYAFINGMETGLFTLLTGSALLFLLKFAEDKTSPFHLAATLVLAALTRPEGNILAACAIGTIGIAHAAKVPWARRDALLQVTGVFVVGNGIYLLWRHAYYGFWFPNTFYAKVGLSASQVSRGFDYAVWSFSTLGLLTILLLVAGCLGFRRSCRHVILAAFCALYAAYITSVGGDYVKFPRFLIPVIPFLYVLAGAGTASLHRVATRFVGGRMAAAIVLIVACGMIAEARSKSGIAREYRADRSQRMELMRSIGEWVSVNTAPNATIAGKYIGALGYYSGRRLLDMHGLTNLHIGHLPVKNMGTGMAGHEKEDLEYVLARRPDYIFSNLRRSRRGALTQEDEDMERILEHYDQLEGSHLGHSFYYFRSKGG